MKLKEVVFSTCDDSYEDIKVKKQYWPEECLCWHYEPFSNSELAWRRKLTWTNSRIDEGRETKLRGKLVVGSVLQDSGAQQHSQLFQVIFFNVANSKLQSWNYWRRILSLMLYNAQILCFSLNRVHFQPHAPCSDQSAVLCKNYLG
jgi:hypothetical protein